MGRKRVEFESGAERNGIRNENLLITNIGEIEECFIDSIITSTTGTKYCRMVSKETKKRNIQIGSKVCEWTIIVS